MNRETLAKCASIATLVAVLAATPVHAVSPLADFSYDYQDLDFKPGARGTE